MIESFCLVFNIAITFLLYLSMAYCTAKYLVAFVVFFFLMKTQAILLSGTLLRSKNQLKIRKKSSALPRSRQHTGQLQK
jgi:hypothetical protein